MTLAINQYPPLGQSFSLLKQIGEGSFGVVYLAQKVGQSAVSSQPISNENINFTNFELQNSSNSVSLKPNSSINTKYFALKKLKLYNKKKYGTSEIPKIENYAQLRVMRSLNHPNLMNLQEIIQNNLNYESNHYLVMDFGIELMELMKHKEILISKEQIRCIIAQIVEGLAHMHQSGFMHRDVKPSNIYLFPDGTVKLGDFSISRTIQTQQQANADVMLSEQQQKKLSEKTIGITTRQYRAPEIMYGSRHYDQSIDIWGLGCTLAQFLIQQMIFPGTSDIGTLQLIFNLIGSPSSLWPDAQNLPYYLDFGHIVPTGIRSLLTDCSPELLDFVERLLTLDPKKRPTAKQLKSHAYLSGYDLRQAKLQLGKTVCYLQDKKLKQILKYGKMSSSQ